MSDRIDAAKQAQREALSRPRIPRADDFSQRALTIGRSQAAASLAPVSGESKASAVARIVGTWQAPPAPNANYERVAREGYGMNEVIYACIEELSVSAAEPILRAYKGDDMLESHPILDLLAQPNPFLTGYDYIASLIMYRSLAGNAYTEKVYDRYDKNVVELHLIRPDRMTVLPDPVTKVGGYRFRMGNFTHDYPVREIGHYKIRNPLDDRYGLAPMSVLLSRTDTDNFAREFTKAFFFNAGVPSTLLAFKNILEDDERDMVRSRFRSDYSSQAGWHNIMVTEANEVDVKQLGMPMGARGIAYPELDEINEARLSMVFGVPLTLIGARLGQRASSYANKVSDREMFWNQTLVPIYHEIEANFNAWLVPDFPDVDYVKFDMSTVVAFAEETDVQFARARNNIMQGLMAWREGRKAVGLVEDPDDDDIIFVPSTITPMKFGDFKKFLPVPVSQSGGLFGNQPGSVRNENGPGGQPMVPATTSGNHSNGNGNGNRATQT